MVKHAGRPGGRPATSPAKRDGNGNLEKEIVRTSFHRLRLAARGLEGARTTQVKAALSVNRELILLYWHIGREILRCQGEQGWGAKVVERLTNDLRAEFPEMSGWSYRNLLFMQRAKEPAARLWYARKTLEHGWSRAVLTGRLKRNTMNAAARPSRTLSRPCRLRNRTWRAKF
jgi:predicted nuclease of restriction endonuclease-like (RecB) superfamily